MTYAIMLGVFVVLLFLGAPIALSLGMSSLLAILYNGTGINVIAGQIYGGIGKYLLLAVPFFVLSGNIMAKAGISDRLIAFIDALLGHLRGGIAMVCVVVACFFGAISGSGAATVAALESLGAQVCVTESCTGGVLTRLSGGETSVEWVNLPEPETGVRIERVEPGADRITLANDGTADADLSGWMLVSEKGNEWFVLPEGTTIAAGGRLILGTNSTDGAFDLLWDDKKVVHKSKTDLFTLYDANGMTVDAMDNGL